MKIKEKQIALAIVAALGSTSALALVGGSIDPNTADSPWAGVGSITINGSIFSGVMLDSTHVLTAAHVVAGQVSTAGNVSFSLNAGAYSQTLTATSISVFSGYTGTTPGSDGVWHDDLAVVTLNAPITGVVGYDLYNGSLKGQTITLVGYGGTGSTVKTVGQNVVDLVLNDDDSKNPQNKIDEVYVFDFDGLDLPNSYGGGALGAGIEAGYTSGDSGSPVFIYAGGKWQIAGIANFNGTSSTGGPIGGGTIVSSYIPWINEQMAAPVPEPRTWAMMLVGMGLVGAAVRAKSKA